MGTAILILLASVTITVIIVWEIRRIPETKILHETRPYTEKGLRVPYIASDGFHYINLTPEEVQDIYHKAIEAFIKRWIEERKKKNAEKKQNWEGLT